MPSASFIENAAAYCTKLTQRSRSNFYYAFLFLPREKREALEAVYAYCRLVDDVVDEEAPEAHKREGIERWRRELDTVFDAAGPTPAHPVSAKLREAVSRFAIRREDMEAVIDGCAMDISKTRYRNWDELRTYCYRVASAVGLMCIEIFGYSQPRAREYAIDLGIALQLTNILRDVAEDARRGRIYLPSDELELFGVGEADLVDGRRTPEFLRLMRHNAARARAHYLRARAAIGDGERRRLVIAEIMGDIYYALLERLEGAEFAVFGDKLTVGRGHKMAIALGKFAQAKLHSFVAA
jgi:15-cis-phytoene synthase